MQYDLSTKTKSVYRIRGLNNLLRMGHCAPAVMQTVLDINHTQREDLVTLMAGMPGGIGNTGFECGGITSPLVLLGLRHGLREMHDGLPRLFDLGHGYYQRFSDENAASFCKAIQNPRLPVRCIHAVRHSPELLAESLVRLKDVVHFPRQASFEPPHRNALLIGQPRGPHLRHVQISSVTA